MIKMQLQHSIVMKMRHADQTKHKEEKAELEFKLMRMHEHEGGMSDSGSESSDGGE